MLKGTFIEGSLFAITQNGNCIYKKNHKEIYFYSQFHFFELKKLKKKTIHINYSIIIIIFNIYLI